jgi:hypothetical protein
MQKTIQVLVCHCHCVTRLTTCQRQDAPQADFAARVNIRMEKACRELAISVKINQENIFVNNSLELGQVNS